MPRRKTSPKITAKPRRGRVSGGTRGGRYSPPSKTDLKRYQEDAERRFNQMTPLDRFEFENLVPTSVPPWSKLAETRTPTGELAFSQKTWRSQYAKWQSRNRLPRR